MAPVCVAAQRVGAQRRATARRSRPVWLDVLQLLLGVLAGSSAGCTVLLSFSEKLHLRVIGRAALAAVLGLACWVTSHIEDEVSCKVVWESLVRSFSGLNTWVKLEEVSLEEDEPEPRAAGKQNASRKSGPKPSKGRSSGPPGALAAKCSEAAGAKPSGSKASRAAQKRRGSVEPTVIVATPAEDVAKVAAVMVPESLSGAGRGDAGEPGRSKVLARPTRRGAVAVAAGASEAAAVQPCPEPAQGQEAGAAEAAACMREAAAPELVSGKAAGAAASAPRARKAAARAGAAEGARAKGKAKLGKATPAAAAGVHAGEVAAMECAATSTAADTALNEEVSSVALGASAGMAGEDTRPLHAEGGGCKPSNQEEARAVKASAEATVKCVPPKQDEEPKAEASATDSTTASSCASEGESDDRPVDVCEAVADCPVVWQAAPTCPARQQSVVEERLGAEDSGEEPLPRRRSWSDGDLQGLIEALESEDNALKAARVGGTGINATRDLTEEVCATEPSAIAAPVGSASSSSSNSNVSPSISKPEVQTGIWLSDAADLVAAWHAARAAQEQAQALQAAMFPALDRSVYLGEQYFD